MAKQTPHRTTTAVGRRAESRFIHGVVLMVIAAILRSLPLPATVSEPTVKIVRSARTTSTDFIPTTKIGSIEVTPVNCSTIIDKEQQTPSDARLVTMNVKKDKPFIISFPKWRAPKGQTVDGAGHCTTCELLLELQEGEIFIDVGANIGDTSIPALVAGIETFAFDPLAFDILKICEARQANVEQGYATHMADKKYFLYRALVGDELRESFDISRPVDSFGKFEQASIFPQTVGVVRKPTLVTESVPMVTLDSIISDDSKPIGLVKIDVQGAEMMVVQGMQQLLSRTKGYPAAILYEEQARITKGAGVQLGAVKKYLEGFGYSCHQQNGGADVLCRKPRPLNGV